MTRKKSGGAAASKISPERARQIVGEVEADIEAGSFTVSYPRRGRPSLTGKHETSPSVGFRLTPELRAQAERIAKDRGISVSALARQALEEFLRNAS